MDGPFADTALALVAALPALHAQSPGIVALLVGDGDRFGDVKSACDAANRAMGRRAAVAVGGQEDVVPYLLSSDVVVAVARAALEAMSCGKPVVFAGEGGFRGPIGEGALDALRRSNFTARGSGEPTTPQALAQAVATFLSDPSRARAAGDLGRQIVSSEYSWDVLVKRTLEVYEAAQDMHVMGEGRDGRV
jgi:glycosyltransferase involved in cell wall biosynthesis